MKFPRRVHLLRPTLLVALLLAGAAHADDRVVRSADGPAWLYAVARLEIPGSRYVDGRHRHHLETCSATLLADPSSDGRPLLLTAWHCLEYYNDLSRPLRVSLETVAGEMLVRDAFRLADGGGMHADWALLGLRGRLPERSLPRLPLATQRENRERPVSMAGYSRDPGLGRNGTTLTWDPDCRITAQSRHSTATDCHAHKGASGGAVVQVDDAGRSYLAGVISQGDGAGYSGFVPVTRLRGAVAAFLR